MSRNSLLLAGAALIAAVVGTYLFWTPPVANVQVPNYLDRAGGEAQLPPESRNELLRRVQYAADGFTRQRLVVYFTNGDTGVTLFHADGSLDVFRYHPTAVEIDWKASKLTEKNLKMLLRIGPDGKTVRDERRWDVDGHLVRIGLRLPSGGFQVQGFFADGKSAENSLYSSGGVLESQLTYWRNGNPKIVLKAPNPGTKEWSSFAENGKKIAWSKTEGGNERGEFYYEDGTTARMKYSKVYTYNYYSGTSSVTVTYFDSKGSLTQTRVYSYGSFTVDMVKNGSTPAYSQRWKVIDSKKPIPAVFARDNLVLETIQTGRFDGLESVYITLNGGKVVTVRGDRRLPTGGVEVVVRTYRADGTLEKETVRLNANPTERTFSGDSGGRIALPDVLMSAPSGDAPPVYASPSSYMGGGY